MRWKGGSDGPLKDEAARERESVYVCQCDILTKIRKLDSVWGVSWWEETHKKADFLKSDTVLLHFLQQENERKTVRKRENWFRKNSNKRDGKRKLVTERQCKRKRERGYWTIHPSLNSLCAEWKSSSVRRWKREKKEGKIRKAREQYGTAQLPAWKEKLMKETKLGGEKKWKRESESKRVYLPLLMLPVLEG